MVLVNKMNNMGLPPQLCSTLSGVNKIMGDVGFPSWTLVRWPVPPLYSLWLLLVLIISGLRWFAMFQILFILYKFCDDYGIAEFALGSSTNVFDTRSRLGKQTASSSRSRSTSRTTPASHATKSYKSTSETLEDDENDDDDDDGDS